MAEDSAALTNNDGASLRLVKNTVVLIALRVVVPLLAVALMLVLSRRLGVEGVGRYSLAFGFLYLFNTLGPLGLYPVITREGARNPVALKRILTAAFTLGTVSSLSLTVIMALLGPLLGYDPETTLALMVLSLAILPYTLGMFLEGACIALERAEYVAAATLTEYALKVGIGILCLQLGYGLAAVLVMAVLGRAVMCLVAAGFLRRLGVPVGWGREWPAMRRLLGVAPTFMMITVFATLYWRIDILMLSKLQDMASVGYYGAAWRLVEIAMVVPASLCLALYPRLSSMVGSAPQELAGLGWTALRYHLALSLPLAVMVTLLGSDLLALLFGEPFREAAATLGVLIWTLVPYGLVRYHAYLLVAANLQRIDLLLNVVMSAVNVILNLLLIPRYGHLGAALATFIAINIYTLLQYALVSAYLPGAAAPLSFQPAVVVASLLVGVVSWLLTGLHLLVAIVLAGPVYLVVLTLTGFFSADELALIRAYRIAAAARLRSRRGDQAA